MERYRSILTSLAVLGPSCRATRQVRGEDLQTTVTLEFMDSIKGTERVISVPAMIECATCDGTGRTGETSITNCRQCRGTGMETMSRGFFIQQMTCSRCGGSGRIIKNPCTACDGAGQTRGKRTVTVVVPPGVDTGDSLRLPSKGNAGLRGGGPGSLYVKVRVKEDPYFHRDGEDLHVVAPITYSQVRNTIRTLSFVRWLWLWNWITLLMWRSICYDRLYWVEV